MKKVVLITTGQPASNPRIVKEATALANKGYSVVVLYSFWVAWAWQFDKDIRAHNPQIQWIELGGNPVTKPALYFLTRIRHKLYRILHRLLPKSLNLGARAELRVYSELLSCAKKQKGDLYIAHNLGALPIAAKAAGMNETAYAFDAEDFHRGEVEQHSSAFVQAKCLEDSFLPKAGYITAASPLIAKQYSALYTKNAIVVNNVFSRSDQPEFKTLSFDCLKMIWFSQTVGLTRGIQDVLIAANGIKSKKIHLTIIGLSDEKSEQELRRQLTNTLHTLHFIQPVNETELLELCSQHHIGLALERKEPLNRDICLTNKIFTYLLAGNAIIASDTTAQRHFFEENKGVGWVYPTENINVLRNLVLEVIDNEEQLTKCRITAYALASQKFNWEEEKYKFLAVVDNVLN